MVPASPRLPVALANQLSLSFPLSECRRSHASLVVERLLEAVALEEFVRAWRRHFLERMSPRFLPPHWDVNSRVANSDAPPELEVAPTVL
jgi:hypothetical protein